MKIALDLSITGLERLGELQAFAEINQLVPNLKIIVPKYGYTEDGIEIKHTIEVDDRLDADELLDRIIAIVEELGGQVGGGFAEVPDDPQ